MAPPTEEANLTSLTKKKHTMINAHVSIEKFVFLFSMLLVVSCKPKTTDSADSPVFEEGGVQIVEEKLPEEITIKGDYSTTGPFLNVPVHSTQEITYYNGHVIKEKSITLSSDLAFEVIQEYDSEHRVTSLISKQNGVASVRQTNTYNDKGQLIKELRIEKNDSDYDTIIYEYHYTKDTENLLEYYRTNNGTKVTEMTLTKSKNKDVLVESAVGSEDYVGITTTTMLKNQNGLVTENQQTSITSDWQDKSKLDTIVYEPIFYQYNSEGRVIREESERVLTVNGLVESTYDKDGILLRKVITKKGKRKSIVKFKRI